MRIANRMQVKLTKLEMSAIIGGIGAPPNPPPPPPAEILIQSESEIIGSLGV